ncbi:MAG: bifunctional hydroxymethylpyrimidine kinase/phosphomethylpyrimidine kinase [Lentisphaeraceae bacterium]|nr:bifunctional hydroxymethylpyrimidine kinase/phosphomethylpyrimidine kinase [Lentisphaeraceae bacterium]
MNSPTCITIAGSDSGGEAGIQADMQTFADFNTHPTCVITAVTAQNPDKIISLNPQSPSAIEDQLLALVNYFDTAAIKTGLLPSSEHIEIIHKSLPKSSHLVIDPIIISTSGREIMDSETRQTFTEKLLPRATIITPNWPEAEILCGHTINNEADACTTAIKLSKNYSSAIYLKGGHSSNPGIDFFIENDNIWKLEAPELTIKSSHGTGCRLSAALCALLSRNDISLIDMATQAKNYVYHSLKSCRLINDKKWGMSSPGAAHQLHNIIKVTKL